VGKVRPNTIVQVSVKGEYSKSVSSGGKQMGKKLKDDGEYKRGEKSFEPLCGNKKCFYNSKFSKKRIPKNSACVKEFVSGSLKGGAKSAERERLNPDVITFEKGG